MKKGGRERKGERERDEEGGRGHSDEEILMKIVDLSKKYPRSDKFSLFGFALVLEV